MPQLAPMPWITLLILLFLFKSLIITSLWSHRPPLFSMPTINSPSSLLPSTTWAWSF